MGLYAERLPNGEDLHQEHVSRPADGNMLSDLEKERQVVTKLAPDTVSEQLWVLLDVLFQRFACLQECRGTRRMGAHP